tara:strand:- start:684 stop:1121 length:438 start_codon:yes stop_codon:yes gene_type:complete
MIKFKTEFKNSYWANTGVYSGQILDKLIEELVPDIGRAKTIHGELLRCIINLDYEYHNNGNGNTFGMHNWTNLDSHWEEQLFFLIENMDDKVSAKILKGFVSSASRDVHRFKYYKLYNDVFDSVIYQVFTTKDRKIVSVNRAYFV